MYVQAILWLAVRPFGHMRSDPFQKKFANQIRHSIRTRARPVADVEIGARTAQVCQLGNIGYQLRQMLRWDPRREEFVDNAEANRLRASRASAR